MCRSSGPRTTMPRSAGCASCAAREEQGTHKVNYKEALVEAAREEMQRDRAVFIMGEDVGLYGGAYGATKGPVRRVWLRAGQGHADQRGDDRRRGRGRGDVAACGPIAEIMYVDFTPLAMDQIANQGAKNRYMFGGKTNVPMVVRTEGGAGRSIAAHHSQSLEACGPISRASMW